MLPNTPDKGRLSPEFLQLSELQMFIDQMPVWNTKVKELYKILLSREPGVIEKFTKMKASGAAQDKLASLILHNIRPIIKTRAEAFADRVKSNPEELKKVMDFYN